MERRGDEVHISTDEARSGNERGIVRYVLAISLALAIIALSVIWITGALSGPQHRADDAARVQSERP